MVIPSVLSQMSRRVAALAFLAVVVAGVSARTAFASGGCVEACVSTYGVSFYNSNGDYFLLKSCTSSGGWASCTYSRMPAIE